MTRSASEADDIAQEVFLKAFPRAPPVRGTQPVSSRGSTAMAVNRSLNARRDRARRGEDTIDDPRLELAIAVDSRENPGRAAELARDLRAPAPRTRLAARRHAHDRHPRLAPGHVPRRGRRHSEGQRRHDRVAHARGASPSPRRHDPERIPRKRGELSSDFARVLTELGLPIVPRRPSLRPLRSSLPTRTFKSFDVVFVATSHVLDVARHRQRLSARSRIVCSTTSRRAFVVSRRALVPSIRKISDRSSVSMRVFVPRNLVSNLSQDRYRQLALHASRS